MKLLVLLLAGAGILSGAVGTSIGVRAASGQTQSQQPVFPSAEANTRKEGPGAAQEGAADLVLKNGNIYTANPDQPRVQALAISGEWIVATGTDYDTLHWIGPNTRVIDLKGQFAMPGFNDAHTHLASGGQAKLEVNLEGAASLADFQQRIRDRLKDYKPGQWITGRGWDHTLWPDKKFPTREDLDAVSKDFPMIFGRVDGHVAVANSAALKAAGITKKTADPPSGHIERDAKTGEPTGMLEEDSAMQLVWSKVPPFSAEQLRRAIELALEEVARNGVTSVQDNSVGEGPENGNFGWANFHVYKQLQSEGVLTARITEWLPFGAPLEQLEKWRDAAGEPNLWVNVGALKGFFDGSLGSRTAAMLAPYSDDPSTSGILRLDPAKTKQLAIERDKAGFQIAFHAIGDRANRLALDVFAAVQKANGTRDRRERIEHAQVVAALDFERFRQLGVIASMQPSHETTDMRWAEERIGADRARGAYAWHSMLQNKVRLAFGTDYPVEPINPMRGLYACVTRELPEGGPKGGWEPQEKITIEECIAAYTRGSAYAEFQEDRKGQIINGKLADIVVLSSDVTKAAPAEILGTQAMMTIVGGRVVYEKK
jgi:predicted amidohydrolase YtcJ